MCGGREEELEPVRTQIELLDLYWQTRVIGEDDQGDARETVLRAVVGDMLAHRSLQADRAAVATLPASSVPLHELLSNHIIQEWVPPKRTFVNRDILVFSHHILFDYAVARLLFRGKVGRFIQQLIDHPAYAISVRASIHLHLQYEWLRDLSHESFWELAYDIVKTVGVPAIARIIPAIVVAELAQRVEDFAPLVTALHSIPAEPTALLLLGHLCGGLIAGQRGVVGADAPPCCALLDQVTESGDEQVALVVVSLMMEIVQRTNALTEVEIDAFGRASRRLLKLGWEGAA
jgi:hypothetical protein